MIFALRTGDIPREAEEIHNRWFEVLYQELVQYNNDRAKKAEISFKRCK